MRGRRVAPLQSATDFAVGALRKKRNEFSIWTSDGFFGEAKNRAILSVIVSRHIGLESYLPCAPSARTYRKNLPSATEKKLPSNFEKILLSKSQKKVLSEAGKILPSESQKILLDFYKVPSQELSDALVEAFREKINDM